MHIRRQKVSTLPLLPNNVGKKSANECGTTTGSRQVDLETRIQVMQDKIHLEQKTRDATPISQHLPPIPLNSYYQSCQFYLCSNRSGASSPP